MVEIEKDYVFDGPERRRPPRRPLRGPRAADHLPLHVRPRRGSDGCPSCTAGTDELSPGFLEHLHTRDTSYAMVSRAPLEKLERWKAKQGWDIPWYSSFGTDFNYDFGVTDRRVGGAAGSTTSARRRSSRRWARDFFDGDQPFEMPGRSCFLQVDGRVFHTYSQYARGLESTGGSYYFLDLTALGRQEEWEEPKGRSDSVRSATPDFAS